MTWKDRLPQLIEFCAKGWTSSRIAQALGVTRNAVIGARHRNGLSISLEQELTRRAAQKFKANRARQATKHQFGKAKSPTRQPKKGPERTTSSLTVLAPPPTNGTVPFISTKLGQCRWICEDGLCCGHKTTTISSSWCHSHYRIVFVPSPYHPRPWRPVHG
jgi:hypothetical protein